MKASLKISLLHFLKKFQYFIFFSICSVILISQIYSCLLKYLSVPTYISSYITNQNKVSSSPIKYPVYYKSLSLIQLQLFVQDEYLEPANKQTRLRSKMFSFLNSLLCAAASSGLDLKFWDDLVPSAVVEKNV